MYLPHQQRVIDEQDELGKKLTKLTEFLKSKSETLKSLPPEDVQLLILQKRIMNEYFNILQIRISRF